MSAIAYEETYRLPAGLLALAVHGVLFAVLFFGFSWQAQPPQGMVVDIWDSLPGNAPAPVESTPPPPEKIKPQPRAVEPARPEKPAVADIELADREKRRRAREQAALAERRAKAEQQLRVELEAQARRDAEAARAEQAARDAQDERDRAEQAATGRVVDEFIGKIRAKIRRNIILPRDVPEKAQAEFNVTLLPGGSVLNARLIKPSGDPAYDAAVERAIFKASPLPLPDDAALFNRFRQLHLKFNPVE